MADTLTDEALSDLLAEALCKPKDGYVVMVACLDLAALVSEVQALRAKVREQQEALEQGPYYMGEDEHG